MSKVVYISPSNQDHNVGFGNYGTEQKRMFEIGEALKIILGRCNVTAYIAKKGMTYQAAVAESNCLKADIHLPIHSNAANTIARGTLSMYTSANGQRLASAIYNQLAPFTPTSDMGCKENKNLYELNDTNAVAAYTEIAFHDNKDDAALIINNIEHIADLIAKGVCQYLGISYIGKPAPVAKVQSVKSDVMYRVVTGSFSNRSYAEIRIAELKNAGFDSFIDLK